MYPVSNATELINQVWKQARRNAENARKDAASLKLDFFNDAQAEHILSDIQSRYKWPEKLIPVSVNVVKKIVRALSMVYLQDATRDVDGTEQDQAIFSTIEDEAGLPTKMKQANRYAKLLGTILLRPLWRNGKIDLDILTPDILDVTTGDSPEDIRSVLVTLYDESGDAGQLRYSLWTAEEYCLLDCRGNVLLSEPNPYGVIPFVPVWNSPPTEDFWQPGANDLMMIQTAISQRLTDLMYTLQFQGFGVGYVRGVSSDEVLTVGPGSMMTLPKDGDVGFATPNAPTEASLDAIEFLAKYAAVTNGLPAGTMSADPTEESGIAKIVGNRELEELRRDDIANFAKVEAQLFDLFRIVWNFHNPGNQISDTASLVVDFYDPKPSTSTLDQLKEWSGLIDLGLMSPVDALMERNPDLTRDMAKARLLEIAEENKEFSPYQTNLTAYPA